VRHERHPCAQAIDDNCAGAAGNLGIEIVAKPPPDGHTLLHGVISSLAINVTLYGSRLPYNPEKDFAPISLNTKVPYVISMHPSVPASTLKHLIVLAKAGDRKLKHFFSPSAT